MDGAILASVIEMHELMLSFLLPAVITSASLSPLLMSLEEPLSLCKTYRSCLISGDSISSLLCSWIPSSECIRVSCVVRYLDMVEC